MEKRVLTGIWILGVSAGVLIWPSAAYSQVNDSSLHPWASAASAGVPEYPLEALHRFHEADTLWITEHFRIDTVNGWRRWEINESHEFGKFRGSLPMIADLESLHPYFRDRVKLLIRKAGEKGISLTVVEAYRTPTKQSEYKRMGRNYTRSSAGKSKHQFGLAVDLVPLVDSVAVWNNQTLWRKVGQIGESLGLRWGGRWRHPYDPGHFEWTGGLGIQHLTAGILPKVSADAYPCIEEDLALLRKYWKALEWEQSELARLNARQPVVVGGNE
jgi:peptidoglycan L-alanyl-D-glutamate endopeptidase CwlK